MNQADSISGKLIINILFISIGFFLSFSCNKEGDNEPSQPVRLKEVIHLQNGSEIKKFVLQYDNVDIIKIATYIPAKSEATNWSQSGDLSMYYIDNRIESVQSDFYDGDWYQQKVKVDIFTSQNIVYRTLYYNYNPDLDDWKEDEKAEFHGDGIQLSSINYFDFETGGWFEHKRDEYEYSSGILSNQKEFQWTQTDWILSKNCEMIFENDNVQEIYESRPVQGIEYKFVITYINNSIESIKKYMDHEGDWLGIETLSFRYDQSGNLIEYESVHHQHHTVILHKYTYEPGVHNLWHYLQSESIFHYPLPLPYPVLLVN